MLPSRPVMRVAIIGAGGVGSAAARYLAREGHEVLLVEQFEIDHDRGSSFGDSRVTRYTYSDPLYTSMMFEAYRLWEVLQAEADELLQTRCGMLAFGPPGHPEIAGMERSLATSGVPYERLDAAAVARRWPQFRLEPGEIGLWQADGGFLRASRCVRANVRLAQAHGARVLTRTAVTGVEPCPGGLRLQLSRTAAGGRSQTGAGTAPAAGPAPGREEPGKWREGSGGHVPAGGAAGAAARAEGAVPGGPAGGGAERAAPAEAAAAEPGPGGEPGPVVDRVIVTAGPWAGRLLAHLGLPLTVVRQLYVFLRPRVEAAAAFEVGRFPVWLDAESDSYGFPSHGRIPGVKLAFFYRGATPTDPDRVDREVHEPEREALRVLARRRLPDLTGEVTFEKVCLYTMTPDHDFVVGTMPDEPRIVFVAGLSGHGFKFTVLLGRIAADLALGRDPGLDLSRFSPARFAAAGSPAPASA